MKSARQELLDLLESLPDDTPMDLLFLEMHFKASVIRGLADAERGAVVSHEEVGAAIARWQERGHVGRIFDD